VVTYAAAASLKNDAAAVDASTQAFGLWSQMGRRTLLLRGANSIERRGKELIAVMVAETGATETWGAINVKLAANMLREAAAMTTQVAGEVPPSDQRRGSKKKE